jgi:hypothetical protein
MANRCCARAWFTFINEDIGINGIKTHVDVSPRRKLDCRNQSAGARSVSARRGMILIQNRTRDLDRSRMLSR